MIQEQEILDEIKSIRNKTELYSDFYDSHFWGEIDKQLKDIENKFVKDKKYINGKGAFKKLLLF